MKSWFDIYVNPIYRIRVAASDSDIYDHCISNYDIPGVHCIGLHELRGRR